MYVCCFNFETKDWPFSWCSQNIHWDMPITWIIGPISTPSLTWGEVWAGHTHKCPTCGISLLTGEVPGFCCGAKGSCFHDVPPLPPLPPAVKALTQHPEISSLSHILNLVFSFSSLETTHAFLNQSGPPGFLAIQGCVYHHVCPTHVNSVVRWLLFDGFLNNTPHQQWAELLPGDWIDIFRQALLEVNPFVQALQHLSFICNFHCPDASLILQDSGVSKIAAIMSYDNTSSSQIKARSLVISHSNRHTQKVPTLSQLWEPLAYSLLFPHRTLGWGLLGQASDVINAQHDADVEHDVPTTQMWHYCACLLWEQRFQIFRHLANEYAVDMFSRNLECKLNYIRQNQQRIHREDAELMGLEDVAPSENIYLPPSFLGSKQWTSNQIADSLAIAAALGNPTFFVTMTCNTNWPEIQSQLWPS